MPALFRLYGQLSSDAFKPSEVPTTSDRPRDCADGSLLPGSVNITGANAGAKPGRIVESGGQTEGGLDGSQCLDVISDSAEVRTVQSANAGRERLRQTVLSALLSLLTRGTPQLVLEEGSVADWMRALVDGLVGSILVAEKRSRALAIGFRGERNEQNEGMRRRVARDVSACMVSTMGIVKRLNEVGAAASEALWSEVDERLAAGLGLFTLDADGLGKLPEESGGNTRAGVERQEEPREEVAETEAERSESGTAGREDDSKEAAGEALRGPRGIEELGALFRVLRELLRGDTGHSLSVEMVGRCGESLLAAGRFLAGTIDGSGGAERPNVAADRPLTSSRRPVNVADRPLTPSRGPVKLADRPVTPSDRPECGVEMDGVAVATALEAPVWITALPSASQLVEPYVDLLVTLMGLIPDRPRLDSPATCRQLRSRAECSVDLHPESVGVNEEGASETAGGKSATVSSAGEASESEIAATEHGADVLSDFLLEALGGSKIGRAEVLGASPVTGISDKVPGEVLTGNCKRPRSVACLVPFAVSCLTGTEHGTDTGAERSGVTADRLQKAADIVGSVRRFLEQAVQESGGNGEGWIREVLRPWLEPGEGAALTILRLETNDVLQKEVLLLVEFAFSLGTVSKSDERKQAPSGLLNSTEGSPVTETETPNPFHVPLFTDAFLEHHVAAALRLLTSSPSSLPDAATCSNPPGRQMTSAVGPSPAELCALHLRVVTAIAREKSPGAVSKLYQLGIMGRLVEQIGLEHESTLVALPSPLSGLKTNAHKLSSGDSLGEGGQNGESNISLNEPKEAVALEGRKEGVLADSGRRNSCKMVSEKGGSEIEGGKMDMSSSSDRRATDARASGGSVTPVVPRLRLGTLQLPTTGVKPLSPVKPTAGKSARLASPKKAPASSSRRGSLGNKENVGVDATRAADDNGGGSGTRAGVKLPKLALSKLPANGGGGGAKSPFRGGLSPGESGGVQMSAWSSRLYAKDPSRKHLLSPVPPISERNSAESVSASGKALSARGPRSRREPLPKALTARVSLPTQGAVLAPLSARERGPKSVRSRKDTWHDLNDEVERQMGSSDASSDSDASDGTCSDSEPERDPPLAVVPLRHSDVIRLDTGVTPDVMGDKVRSTVSLESSGCSNVWDDDDKESSWESRSMGSARIAAVGLGGAQISAVGLAPAKRPEPFMARVEREALAGASNASAEGGRPFGLQKLGSEVGVKALVSENLGLRANLGLEKEDDLLGVQYLAARPVPRLKLPLAARKDQSHKDPHHAPSVGGWVNVTKPVTEAANPSACEGPIPSLVGRPENGSGSVQSDPKPTSPQTELRGLSGPIGKVPGLSLPIREGHVSSKEASGENGADDGRSVREAKRIAAHYAARRVGRLLYSVEGLHVAVLELILCMMTSAE